MPDESKKKPWASWLDESYLVLVFGTNHETMSAESVLKKEKIRSKLIPKPRDERKDCALALTFSIQEAERVEHFFGAAGLFPHRVGTIGKDGTWTPKKWPEEPPSTGSPASGSTSAPASSWD